MNFITKIDQFLNNITMYRLLLLGLLFLSGVSFILSLFGFLPYSFLQFFSLFVFVLLTCSIFHFVLLKLFHSITNNESYLITALILYFILSPITSYEDILITIVASGVAIASRYIFALKKRHIFNPAAIAIFLIGLFGFGNGIWWVGSTALLPFVLVLGLLVVRKVRRFEMFFVFLIVATVTIILFNLRNGLTIGDSLSQVLTSWPIIFFGTIMLTEPITMPGRKKYTLLYGGLVGILFGSQFHIGPFYSSPELSLILGNIFSYIVGSQEKLILAFQDRVKIGKDIYEIRFTKPKHFRFLPGQYLEWTIATKGSDDRGNRRYFTIASSPHEETLKLGVKIKEEDSSSYKKHLLKLKKGEKIIAGQLAGDFVLPSNTSTKLVFIAGGIGVTPFRSMIQDIISREERRDITLFYACSDTTELVYKDIFENASKYGVKTVYIITKKENIPDGWHGESGYLSREMIEKYIQIPSSVMFYISGPLGMVDSAKKVLFGMGIKRRQITTDYFPGF